MPHPSPICPSAVKPDHRQPEVPAAPPGSVLSHFECLARLGSFARILPEPRFRSIDFPDSTQKRDSWQSLTWVHQVGNAEVARRLGSVSGRYASRMNSPNSSLLFGHLLRAADRETHPIRGFLLRSATGSISDAIDPRKLVDLARASAFGRVRNSPVRGDQIYQVRKRRLRSARQVTGRPFGRRRHDVPSDGGANRCRKRHNARNRTQVVNERQDTHALAPRRPGRTGRPQVGRRKVL
jgi:hypothetical protein